MKIHAHPGLPPVPFKFSIEAASNPEKAPDSWVKFLEEKTFNSTLQNAPQMTKRIRRF